MIKFLKTIDWPVSLFSFLIFAFVFLLAVRPPWDPDMGWHLRNGADILRFGAPQGDLYSHTMAGYQWISHEWLTDVLMYLTNQHLGLVALSVIFAFIILAAYFISAHVAKTRIESAMVTVLVAALVALPVMGVRPQMLTLLGLAATLWILFRWRDNPKNKLVYWLIPLMLLWVNMHGGFAAGLILMGAFGVIELVKFLLKRFSRAKIVTPTMQLKHLWELVGVGVLSLAVTFVNPYTWRIYDELFRTIFNDLVRKGINEWLPVNLSSPDSYNLVIYTAFVALLLVFSWKRVDATKIWIGIIFLVISVASWRNMPLFPLVTLPLLSEMIESLAPKGVYYYLRSWWVVLLLLAVVVYLGRDRIYSVIPLATDDALVQVAGHKYPYNAVQYLKEHKLPGKMFNEYNWGGYLVWKLPEKKVFIDGRMAVWKTKDQDIFRDYLEVTQITDRTPDILSQYDVDLALVYTDRPLRRYFVSRSTQWQLVYSDSLASLFRRIELVSQQK